MATQEWTHVHTQEVSVRFRDLDAFGHVNNAIFFTYFEQARVGWWQKVLAPDFARETSVPVIASAQCTYLKPIFYPENIIVELHTKPPGNSSYQLFYRIHSQKNLEVIYAEGLTALVWVDRKSGKPIALPSHVRKHFPTNGNEEPGK